MAKSKAHPRKPRATPSQRAAAAAQKQAEAARRRVVRWSIAAAVIVAVAAVASWFWVRDSQVAEAFIARAARGQAALDKVRQSADEGRTHLAPGERVRYVTDPPTSGAHDVEWVRPGVYDRVQPPTRLVHSLEHGLVVAYYDKPPAEVLALLDDWAGLYGGPWSGLVLAPKPGLGSAIVLTAWRRSLRLDPFDPDAAAAFIDAYRGRGPENRVR